MQLLLLYLYGWFNNFELSTNMQTPILWSHGMDDRTVFFEAGQAGPPFLERAGVSCEFKVLLVTLSSINYLVIY